MARDGFLIGEVAARSGVSRKALRLYERSGILPTARRTRAGYRVYAEETLGLLTFIAQARRLGLRLDDIKTVITIKRSGAAPCPHVYELVQRRAADLDALLIDLTDVRDRLRRLLRSWPSRRRARSVVCPHIESLSEPKRGGRNGRHQDVALPIVHLLPRDRDRG